MKVTYTNTVPMRVAVDSDSGEKRFEPAVDKTYDNIDVLPTKEDLAQIPNKDKDALYIVGEGSSKAIYAYDDNAQGFVSLTASPVSHAQIDNILAELFPLDAPLG